MPDLFEEKQDEGELNDNDTQQDTATETNKTLRTIANFKAPTNVNTAPFSQ